MFNNRISAQKSLAGKTCKASALVEEDGFEPSKPKQQIYSQPPLTTQELFRFGAGGRT